MLQKSLDSIKQNFFEYLNGLGISPESHKNYKSDLVHFSGWLILKLRSFGSYIESLTEAVPFLSHEVAIEYKNYMILNKIPTKTINRRLSTLRHLSRYLFSSENLEVDFMKGIENISGSKKPKSMVSPIINDFQSYLENQKVSKNTVKNYVSDIRQFLTWVESVNDHQLKVNS
jgi:site-specific recombinase XerD